MEIQSEMSSVHDPRYKDVLLIGISVSLDILRQRGNTYLDDLFPED